MKNYILQSNLGYLQEYGKKTVITSLKRFAKIFETLQEAEKAKKHFQKNNADIFKILGFNDTYLSGKLFIFKNSEDYTSVFNFCFFRFDRKHEDLGWRYYKENNAIEILKNEYLFDFEQYLLKTKIQFKNKENSVDFTEKFFKVYCSMNK